MMPVLFILGLPGSGKSRLIRHIVEILEKWQLQIKLFNDYEILKCMFENDNDKQFKAANVKGGFDVIDFGAFDVALKRLGEVIGTYVCSTPIVELVIIEFARNNYEHAFSLLKEQDYLHPAYFLHLNVDVNTCKERVHMRSAKPVYKDDFPVSDYIFEKYYHSDDGSKLPAILSKYQIDESHVLSLPNNATFESITPEIDHFIESLCTECGMIAPVLAQH